jgi:aryl-alcohol dehydrogenase-like predicted oxidoreductase
MQYRKLGNTDLHVSAVCFGGMTAGSSGTFGEQDDQQSMWAVREAIDAGINFFDTAEGYGDGHSEKVLGQALEDIREEAVVATKVSAHNLPEQSLVAACEASLERLRTDYIDLYQVHWPNRDIPFADTAAVLERLKDQGKIRYWGVSNFGRQDLTGALEAGHPEVDQVPYSLLWRAVEHDIVPICVRNAVSVICYSPMAQGILTGKFGKPEDVPPQRSRARYCKEAPQLCFRVVDELRAVSQEMDEPMVDIALAWVLSRPGVASVITGVRGPRQVRENAQAADLQLAADTLERLTRVSGELRDALDDNPDMWQAGENSRYR